MRCKENEEATVYAHYLALSLKYEQKKRLYQYAYNLWVPHVSHFKA